MKKLINKIFRLHTEEPKTKVVKIKISYPDQYENIIEEVSIDVPIGLSEEDEDKFIDEVVDRDYRFLYGY